MFAATRAQRGCGEGGIGEDEGRGSTLVCECLHVSDEAGVDERGFGESVGGGGGVGDAVLEEVGEDGELAYENRDCGFVEGRHFGYSWGGRFNFGGGWDRKGAW